MIDNSQEKTPLEKSYTLLKINLGIFAFYSIVFPLFDGKRGMMFSSGASYIHGIVLLLVGLVFLFNEERRGTGAAMILSSLVLAVIGFSFCIGGFELHIH